MRWQGRRASSNVQDVRGLGGKGIVGGGIGMLLLAVVAMLFGIDPRVVLQGAGGGGTTVPQDAPAPPKDDPGAQFVAVVLADTEDVWTELFRNGGKEYRPPKLVLFSGSVQSACGNAQAAMGPFYCPEDQKVFIDLSFYEDLKQRFGAPGDFAQAYVIAHEVGHHVQNLLGIAEQIHAQRRQVDEVEANQLSVRMELQADCLAGVWAHHAERTKKILEQGDVEEALRAASAIGDDRLQKQSRGQITPETFTHGSSAQRVRWFRQGLETGKLDQCDTFKTNQL